MQHEVAHGVHAKYVDQIIRVDHISLGLTHLALAHKQPRMPEHLLRQRQIQRHQHDRPVDRMEADNVFADQMQIRRPIFFKHLVAVAV